MVDVLLYNLHRIHNLWPIFLDHLVELLSDGRPAVRAAATEALGRAVGGALAHVTAGYAANSGAFHAIHDLAHCNTLTDTPVMMHHALDLTHI